VSAESMIPINSRAEFLDGARGAFALAERSGAREIFLVDANFAEWPLNEVAVIESLARWVNTGRTLTVLAYAFDELARRQLRFIEWRRQWAHVVHCRRDPELEAEQVPTLLLVSGQTCVRVVDRVRWRGTISNRSVDLTGAREGVDALLQRSVDAFPVTTLGL
jgi:hypothetical protein